MSKSYACDLCKKVFNQKIDFTRHTNKKTPCITMREIENIIQTKEVDTTIKNNMIMIFKSCLNILRDAEGLTGEKALRNLSYLLTLKLLEPYFIQNMDSISNYDFDYSELGDDNIENTKKRLLFIIIFSNLKDEKEDNIPFTFKYLWDIILSVHPSTKNIFLNGKGFDIQCQSTYKKLIDKLNKLDLSQTDHDILGNAYEEVIQDIMTGKVFGQFFTNPLVKKMMVKLINPQIQPDGKIETCCDPTMGTGGFLITCLNHIIQQSKTINIKPDWDFIRKEGLYGKEIEPDTYQLAVSNMLISSGHMFENLDTADSIREPIDRKYDIILANPPFGIKGLKYSEFRSPIRSEYVPIKSDNSVSLFIQAIIYMLKVNGRCAVVIPDGQDLFSKSNKTLISIREYLMKTCDLKEVIYLPAGIFSNTTIKTCVFYFIKKKEGKDILEVKIKLSRLNTESSRFYNFTKTSQTTNVKFYDYNPYEEIKNLLVEVPIEKIVNNYYSLNYSEYINDETEEKQYEDGTIIKTLGEVCDFNIGGTPSRCKNEYYENGNNLWISVKELNGGYIYDTYEKITDLGVDNSSVKLFKKDTILFSFKLSIGKTAIVGNPLYTNEAIAGILSKNDNLLNNKYLYYYLTINDFSKLGSGMIGNGSLNKKSLSQIKIPIPPIEKQKEIVEYLDFIYEKANKTSMEKIIELNQLNKFCLNNQKRFGNNNIKTLGEVCDFKNGKNITKEKLIEGEYPVIGGGQKPLGYHNEYNTNENTILCSSSGAYAGFISKYSTKIWASDCFSIKSRDINILNEKYIYYYLKTIQDNIYKLQNGAAQPHVYSKDLQNMKISIPFIEKQKEIVEYLDYNDLLIKQLEGEIENNKTLAKQFIMNIV